MSSLQCPATMLVVPRSALGGLDLSGLRIAHVWSDPQSADSAEPVVADLAVGMTVREHVADRETLGDIADVHPGETVLVISADVVTATRVLADADGWSRSPWPDDTAKDGTAD